MRDHCQQEKSIFDSKSARAIISLTVSSGVLLYLLAIVVSIL